MHLMMNGRLLRARSPENIEPGAHVVRTARLDKFIYSKVCLLKLD